MPLETKLNKAVRQILTRLRLDSNCVNIHFDRGTLTLTGKLQRPYALEERRPDVNFELLHEMDRQLQRMDGIVRVAYVVDNWSHNSDGHWTKKQFKQMSY